MSITDSLDAEPAATALARVDGSDVIIDVARVAPRLELGAEEFQKALRHGAIVGLVEAGRDEDAGRTRVTLRRGDRVWRAVLEADGRVHEERA